MATPTQLQSQARSLDGRLYFLVVTDTEEMATMRAINDYVKRNKRTPKKHEVVGYGTSRDTVPQRGLFRAFDRLKAMGLVIHSTNGHCWLSDIAQYALDA